MESLLRPVYYTLIFFTGILNVFYLWSGILSIFGSDKTIPVKRMMGLGAVVVVYLLYQSFLCGEVHGNFIKGIGMLLCCWLCWLISAGIGFLILR